ncbi:MAG: hypothetical protein JWL71_128 [Acidobacteria bacterium]|nr:hypothetical protein [Acidobacteriota bacterium]
MEDVLGTLTHRIASSNREAATRWLLPTALAAALCGGGCGRNPSTVIADHQHTLTSSQATAAMVGDAWLSQAVTPIYAHTAFEATARVLNERHTQLSADLPLLATRDGAAMSDAEERVSRILASLSDAVERGDTAAARRHLDALTPGSSAP